MFNKLQFNNTIISNKNIIQQGRIHTINKLVQKIRKLKQSQEKNPDNKKDKERLRKSVEIMEELKKLKRVDIIKKILLLQKSPTSIISNVTSTPEEIAIAMLAMNKILQNFIIMLKESLHLDDSDEKWKKLMQELSKRKAKRLRTEGKKEQRKELKVRKTVDRKREEWLKQNNPQNNSNECEDEDREDEEIELHNSSTGIWKVQSIEGLKQQTSKIVTDKKTKNIKMKNAKVASNSRDAIESKTANGEEKKNTREKTLKIEKADYTDENDDESGNNESFGNAEKESIFKNEESKKKIQPKKTQDSLTDDRVPIVQTKLTSSEKLNKEAPKTTLVEDPFFLTETGENYLATLFVPDPNDTNKSESEVEKTKNFNNRKRKQNNEINNYNGRDAIAPNGNKKWKEKSTTDTSTENMHPSWLAKQKFKPTISSFQGQKITFGDDGETINVPPRTTANSKKPNETKHNVNANAEQLHPSWLAKQKLKPVITAFQGKKITFNDDD